MCVHADNRSGVARTYVMLLGDGAGRAVSHVRGTLAVFCTTQHRAIIE